VRQPWPHNTKKKLNNKPNRRRQRTSFGYFSDN